ncbi:hypothetical protein, partial [Streptomyces sp. ADI96-15]|uniref:hypothetical protein n=1 Tax=Streptomyces sp. ADI96-15 TaxID=1522761 RepID=UPI0019D0D3DC
QGGRVADEALRHEALHGLGAVAEPGVRLVGAQAVGDDARPDPLPCLCGQALARQGGIGA